MNDDNLALRPNCLLTRKPLVFVNSSRSLFYYDPLAQPLQKYLSAHGYRVICPPLPFRGQQRTKALLQFLESLNETGFHFILSSNTYSEMKLILEKYPHSSITLTDDFENLAKEHFYSLAALRHQLHQLLLKSLQQKTEPFAHTLNVQNNLLFDRFLDHCIELAENDHICET